MVNVHVCMCVCAGGSVYMLCECEGGGKENKTFFTLESWKLVL